MTSRGKVTITAAVDKIKINDVIVNRGNCWRFKEDLARGANRMQGFNDAVHLPTTLAYGKNFVGYYQDNCNFLEIQVKTSRGDFTFTTQ